MVYDLGVIVLIVIIVLIALQINNWNQNSINEEKDATSQN